MKDLSRTLNVLTHNGVFHSDETLAIALIKYAFPEMEVRVTRGRDISSEEFDVVVDVNGEYNDASASIYNGDYCSYVEHSSTFFGGSFDHHQFKKEDAFYGLSSAGLVLMALTNPLVAVCDTGECPWEDEAFLPYVSEHIKELVDMVDKHDCGIENNSNHPLIKLIQDMNDPDDIYGETQDSNFKLAVNTMLMLLQHMGNKSINDAISFQKCCSATTDNTDDYGWALAEQNNKRKEEIKQEIDELVSLTPVKETGGVKFLIIPKGKRFVQAKFCIGVADFVVNYDNKQDGWGVTQIPLEEARFGGKFSLDPEWNDQFKIFTHKGGFFGIYKEQDLVPYPGEAVGIKIPVKGKIYIDLVL